MRDTDLLNGDDLNNVDFSGYGKHIQPGELVTGKWRTGQLNKGIWLINRNSNSLKTAGDGGGIKSAVRLSAEAKKGSVYHALGTLNKGSEYKISWSATADHDDNPQRQSDFSVRVSVNYDAKLNVNDLGIENKYSAVDAWQEFSFVFRPAETDFFYISFTGGEDKHPGALISKVSAKETAAATDDINISLDSPLSLLLGEDAETTDQLVSQDDWVFKFSHGQGVPLKDTTATFELSGSLCFAGIDKKSFETYVTASKATLAKGRITAPKDFTSATMTVKVGASHSDFTIAAIEKWSIVAVPPALSLSTGQSRTLDLSVTRSGEKIKSATLSVKVSPKGIVSDIPDNVTVTDGKATLSINAGKTASNGALTVSHGHANVQIPVSVTEASHRIVWFGQTLTNQMELNTLKVLHVQVLGKDNKPLEKAQVVMTVVEDHADLQIATEFLRSLPIALSTPAASRSVVALTRQQPDGMYATFTVLPARLGEAQLNFTAPDAHPLDISLLAVQEIIHWQLIVTPDEIHLHPGETLSNNDLINITVAPPNRSSPIRRVHFAITGPSEDGLYVVKDNQRKFPSGTLPVEQGMAKVTTLLAGSTTTPPQTPFTITFSADDAGIPVKPVVTKVFIENGDRLTFYPADTQSKRIPVDLNTQVSLPDCYIGITDMSGKGVGGARYFFMIAKGNTQVKFTETQGANSNIHISALSGIIKLPQLTVGESPGQFQIHAVSATTSSKVFSGWYFIAQEAQPILFIKFAKEHDENLLTSGTTYKNIDTLLAFTDSLSSVSANSGVINFLIDDTDNTQTFFGDGSANDTQRDVTVVSGEAEIPAFTTGKAGSFYIKASVVGTTPITIRKKLTIK